jgi:hypothetical protein
MCDLYELSAHGSRNIVNITDLYNRMVIPENLTFITFAPIGQTLTQTFNDYYTFSLHYYPNSLSKIEYDKLVIKPARTINLGKDICDLTETSLEEDKTRIIDNIIIYGSISIINHIIYEHDSKNSNLKTIERQNNIFNQSQNIFPSILNELEFYIYEKRYNNYENLIKQFMGKTMKDVIIIFMKYLKKKQLNLKIHKKNYYILKIIRIYIKLYRNKISDDLDPLNTKILNLQNEFNKINSKYSNPKDTDDKDKMLQDLKTIKDEINKIKNDPLFEILNRVNDNTLDDYLISNIDDKLLKMAINKFIKKTNDFIKDKINLSDNYLKFIKMYDIFNLKINVYKKSVPNFDFSFYTTYSSKTVFYNGLLKTNESYPFDMLMFSKERTDTDIPKNRLILKSFQYNILSFISEKYDSEKKSDLRTLDITLEDVIRGLEQTSLKDNTCTIVISACNVIYRNNQLISNSDLIKEVNIELKKDPSSEIYKQILKELC